MATKKAIYRPPVYDEHGLATYPDKVHFETSADMVKVEGGQFISNNVQAALGEIATDLSDLHDEKADKEEVNTLKDLVEDAVDGKIQEVLDSEIIATDIEQKLTNLETSYAPRLTAAETQINDLDAEVMSQLAQKAQQTALEVEKERINNLIALPDGSTTNDARLEDIAIGYDGTVYDSPGEAVRQQFGAYMTEENESWVV